MGQLFSTLTRIIPLAIGIIGAVEKMIGAGKGEEKKQAYLEGIMVALGVVEGAVSKDLVDDAKFRGLLGDVADAVVAVNNFIRDHKAKQAEEDK